MHRHLVTPISQRDNHLHQQGNVGRVVGRGVTQNKCDPFFTIFCHTLNSIIVCTILIMQLSNSGGRAKRKNSIKMAYVTCANNFNKAGFVQVLNMCNALTNIDGVELKLWAGFTKQPMNRQNKERLRQILAFSNGRWQFNQQLYPPQLKIQFLNRLVTHIAHMMAILRAWLYFPDIFYTREYRFATIATSLNMNVVVEIHEALTPHFPAHKVVAFAKSAQNKKILLVIATTQKIADDLIDAGVPSSKVVVMPNAAPSATNYALTTKQARQKLDINAKSAVATYTGHLYDGKGISDFLKAATKLPNVRFFVVGGEGDELQNAKSIANSIGASNITFTGQILPTEIPLYQMASDVLVATLHDELFQSPLKITEYVATKKPIVATDIAPISNRLADGKEALLYQMGDADDLAHKIGELLAKPKLAKSLSENAVKRIGGWTWDDRATDILALIKKRVRL